MKKIKKEGIGVLFVVLCLLFYSCGGGESAERAARPVGLFGGPVANFSDTPPSAGAITGAMVIVDSTKNSGFAETQYGSLAEKSLKAIVPNAAKKALESDADVQCTLVAKDRVRCERTIYGEDGFVHFFLDAKVDQHNDTGIAGSMEVRISFHEYVTNDLCNRSVKVMGLLGCNLDFDASIHGDIVTSHFIGPCNTSLDDDNYLDVTVDNDLYKIGLDLGVEFSETTFNINGIVSIDGLNYRFEDIENMDIGICE